MRPDAIQVSVIDNFLSSMRNSTISVCQKPYNFSSVSLNTVVTTIRVQAHNQFIFTESCSLFTLFWLSLRPLLNLELYHLNCFCHPQRDLISAGNYPR